MLVAGGSAEPRGTALQPFAGPEGVVAQRGIRAWLDGKRAGGARPGSWGDPSGAETVFLNGLEENAEAAGPARPACHRRAACCLPVARPPLGAALVALYRTEDIVGRQKPAGLPSPRSPGKLAKRRQRPQRWIACRRSKRNVWGKWNEALWQPGWSVAHASSSLGGRHPLSRTASMGEAKPTSRPR